MLNQASPPPLGEDLGMVKFIPDKLDWINKEEWENGGSKNGRSSIILTL